MSIVPIKRAILSVSDKTDVLELAKQLIDFKVEIISTGGTSTLLSKANIPHKKVEEITGLKEMLGGRVKTLHPNIHGGILGKRGEHDKEAASLKIDWIDLVIVNFYPFPTEKKTPLDEAVELIDIGGPTMVRAAAKNFAWVTVVTDPEDYAQVIKALGEEGGLTFDARKALAQKAFARTASYDERISQYFRDESAVFPPLLNLHFEKKEGLRYGENPHQQASAYQSIPKKVGVLSAKQFQGKALSYNNVLDAEVAFTCVNEFDVPTCVIIKHGNPCGVASAEHIDEAYRRAYHADPLSAFGGIIALNRPCTKVIAEELQTIFTEVLIAPAYEEVALNLLATKNNLRVLELAHAARDRWEMRLITGGLLLQEQDKSVLHKKDLQVVTQASPSSAEIDAMLFAWRVLKHMKSNGILIAKDHMTIGIGAGLVSRIDAVDLAVRKANHKIHGAILASDAFFPFRDSIDHIANSGIRAVIQPGGSVRDEEVIAACNEHHIAMVFTGIRCFKH